MAKVRTRKSASKKQTVALTEQLSGSLGLALLGTKFMGRAHSIAWANAPKFFDLPLQVDRNWAAGRDAAETHEFARKWGWKASTIDWHETLTNPTVQLVDIATPNDVHKEMAIAALEAGRHVTCEKPWRELWLMRAKCATLRARLPSAESRHLCGSTIDAHLLLVWHIDS